MRKISEISIKRKVTVAMFTIAVIIFGIISFTRLKLNLLPDLSYPTVTIRTEYEKAAPTEVEYLITKPIEEAVGIIKNVVRISSVSRAGQSDVVLEFAWGTEVDYSILEIREKMDGVYLPEKSKRPVILRYDPSLDPVIRLGLRKKTLGTGQLNDSNSFPDLKKLRYYAEEFIKKNLETLPGIAAVKISGGLEQEIHVNVDQQKMSSLNMSVSTLSQVISAENVNLSGGNIEEGTHSFLIKTVNRFQSIEDIENVVINSGQGAPVLLKDVAKISMNHKKRDTITRIKGMEAVEIAVFKEGDANIVKSATDILNRLDHIRGSIPDEYELDTIYDQSIFIKNAVNDVIMAGIIGGVLAIVILYAFLNNFWTTIIISLSIPISVIATFNLMYGNNLTLNIMSLGGITLGIGMLLDNSIVVLESIFRFRESGEPVAEAARKGAGEVMTAVVASTLTTIAVFFPLVFVKGIAGQLFRDQALTITFSLIVSLVVALTLIPMLASLGGKKENKQQHNVRKQEKPTILYSILTVFPSRIYYVFITLCMGVGNVIRFIFSPLLILFNRIYLMIEHIYPSLIKGALRYRYFVILLSLVLFYHSVMLLTGMGTDLIPSLSQGEFKIELKLPAGSPLSKTDEIAALLQRKIIQSGNTKTTFSISGSGNRLGNGTGNSGDNYSEITVLIKHDKKSNPENQQDHETTHSGLLEPLTGTFDFIEGIFISNRNRGETEKDVMADVRRVLEGIPDISYKVYRPGLFTFKTPVEIEISGYDLKKLDISTERVMEELGKSERFADIKSTVSKGHPEIQILFDRDRAASLGLNVHDVAQRVVSKVRGEISSKFHYKEQKIDILVRADKSARSSVNDLSHLIVNPESIHPVTLESIAQIIPGEGPGEIKRIDQSRVAVVNANLRFGDLGSAISEVESILAKLIFPEDMTVEISGQNQEMKVSFDSLKFALILAVFLVYLVMASQFESFIHPFVILFSIPLAVIGASYALALTGAKLSVIVFIGAILLAGIVVNNAIVLIDKINQLKQLGKEKTDAIIEAGKTRIRPILMTTLTTTLGLIPMATGFGEGAEIRAPMAITVIGGLTGSTLLTLIVIPVVYSILDRKK